MSIPPRNFSAVICKKFPILTGRHLATPVNARYLLRSAIPTSSLSSLERNELKDLAYPKKSRKVK